MGSDEMFTTELYHRIENDLNALLGTDRDFPFGAALATLIALLRTHHPQISWVGAYLESRTRPGHLYVGPYQGPVACVEIPPGRGVCGTSFRDRVTLIVPDVDQFPGHIACDAASRSEIVIPLYHRDRLVGVLDLDSHLLGAFGEADRTGLEQLLRLLNPLCE